MLEQGAGRIHQGSPHALAMRPSLPPPGAEVEPGPEASKGRGPASLLLRLGRGGIPGGWVGGGPCPREPLSSRLLHPCLEGEGLARAGNCQPWNQACANAPEGQIQACDPTASSLQPSGFVCSAKALTGLSIWRLPLLGLKTLGIFLSTADESHDGKSF